MAHAEVRPMPRAEQELLKRACEAFNRWELDELVKLYHPDGIWEMSKFAGPHDNAVYRGHEGLRRLFEQWHGAWEHVQLESTDMWRVGERSLVTCRLRARGKPSGARVEIRWMQVGETREGLIYRVDNFSDMEEALAAVGLGS